MSYLIKGVQKTEYYYSNFNSLLAHDGHLINNSNIGINGENLTISFLSLNRAELSIKLLLSISTHLPNFKGEVLIIDNGSSLEQLSILTAACSKLSYETRIVELNDNFGVAGGRNRTIEHVKTEWIMFLDNDIYFINNPLPKIQDDISLLGCKFLNLPLLDSDAQQVFAFGGHLYVESHFGNITVGGGTCYQQLNSSEISQVIDQPFLSNFLFGGASIVNKEAFNKIGGFDQNMFIGFEDVDFSIRLFREGYKIGNTNIFSLVHDHPKPENKDDTDYEKKRFSSQIIKESAMYLENKYNYKIWDSNLIEWLEEKNNQLGNPIKMQLEDNTSNQAPPKIKIALILDVDYWAFGNIARQIEKHLSDDFDIYLITMEECEYNSTNLLLRTSDCDILHFFWRECIQFINEDSYKSYFGNIPVSFNDFLYDKYTHKILSTCVYDHLFLDQEDIVKRIALFNEYNYYVCSNKLLEIYNSIDHYSKPQMVIEDGVDDNLFYPINIKRFDDLDRPLIIGWVGNSKWADDIEDFKGFNTIVKPAIDDLIKKGYDIKGVYSDRNDRFVPHEEMVNYYSRIDILICMSKIEGTPNPVLEAMACGTAVISTDVGIVPQVLGDKQQEYILKERNIQSLQESVLSIYHNRDRVRDLSQENLRSIKSWYWKNQTEKFRAYFKELLRKKMQM